VAIGARPMLVEVLAGPRSFSRILRKLLVGYALEALGHERDDAAPDRLAVDAFIRSMAAAPREEHPAVGEGTDVRFGLEDLSGYALVRDRGVLHAAAFANQGRFEDSAVVSYDV
jgi:hypothetical protein